MHQKPRSKASKSDEYATPRELFNKLCNTYNVHPTLDVCGIWSNSKCDKFLTNAEKQDWGDNDIWCNPPHSQNDKFVALCYFHWQSTNRNVMMILPTNTMSTKYWHQCIEGKAEYHPIKGRIRFLVDGKPSEHCSRNAYVCVIWRKHE